ncbi:MAG: ACT domain-containing protein [Planctomycetota bacterium]|nr:ACT domain-containing protein [Planctomycetota bacterium]
MSWDSLTLVFLPDRYAVCRLGGDDPVPDWAYSRGFVSITRTQEELSIVCLQDSAPPNVTCRRDWHCLKVDGPLDFAQAGVLASLAGPLAEEGIPVFVVSTYDTDYLLVSELQATRAAEVLSAAGHRIKTLDQ